MELPELLLEKYVKKNYPHSVVSQESFIFGLLLI